MTDSPETRFWQRVIKTDGCWLWTGPPNACGYGVVRGPFGTLAHRNAYGYTYGFVPKMLDHTCHNADARCPGGTGCHHRLCVNPCHLAPTDQRANAYASGRGPTMANSAKTHCINGHPFQGENLAIREDGKRRRCLACARKAKNESMARLRRGERTKQ